MKAHAINKKEIDALRQKQRGFEDADGNPINEDSLLSEVTSGVKINPHKPDQIPTRTATPPQRPKFSNVPASSQMEDDPQEPSKASDLPITPDARKLKYPKAPILKNPNYQRIALPSKGLVYDFDDIQIRSFRARDLSLVYRAMVEEDFTIMIDAISNTIDTDARLLTVGDFYYIMYWLRIKSYPKSPYSIEFFSRYGNKNKYKVNETTLDVKELTIDEDELAGYLNQGFQIPRVRDLEVFQTTKLTPDQSFLWQIAQYLSGDSIQEKIEIIDQEEDLEIISDIKRFGQLVDHGVNETISVVDQNFDLNTSIKQVSEKFDKRLAQFKASLKGEAQETLVQRAFYQSLSSEDQDLFDELGQMKSAAHEGSEYTPKKEDLQLGINAYSFFPLDS